MTQFKEYELGSVCQRLSSGKNITAAKVFDSAQYPVYGGNGLRGYAEEKNFEGECAIIGRQGAYCGNVRYFSGEAYMTEHAVVVQANESNNTRYLSYLLSTMNLGRLSGQSAQPGLSVAVLGKQIINLPEKNVQDKIVSILSLLDEKIVNNEMINRNLSEQLRLIFEDMFITNADDTWLDKKLGDFLNLERGLSYKGKFLSESEGVPMLNLGNILPNSVFRPEKLKFYTGEFKPRHVVKPGDIIIANTDLTQAREVLGSAIRVPDLGYDNVICSHHISIVKNSTISNNFILGLLNIPAYRTRVAGFATGTTVLALPNDTILNCEFQCPPEELLKTYDGISEPIYKQMEEIRMENDKLAEVRDSLLPKLMSGELDVSELEL
jgi:type I restriction enzyme S subunit